MACRLQYQLLGLQVYSHCWEYNHATQSACCIECITGSVPCCYWCCIGPKGARAASIHSENLRCAGASRRDFCWQHTPASADYADQTGGQERALQSHQHASWVSSLRCKSLSHTLTASCTCCYDEIKGVQDLKIYSHADSLILSQLALTMPKHTGCCYNEAVTHSLWPCYRMSCHRLGGSTVSGKCWLPQWRYKAN